VNPSEDILAELTRTACNLSLVLTQISEANVGSVVRLARKKKDKEAYPTAEDAITTSSGSQEVVERSTMTPSRLSLDRPGLASPNRPSGLPLPRVASFHTQAVVNQVRRVVLGSDARPELTQEGTGGVYMIRESSNELSERSDGSQAPGTPLAVFKPSDEEAGSMNNPRGLVGEEHTMREGFRPGGGAVRERVAYKLDRGFARVPRTAVDTLFLRTNSGLRLQEQCGSIQEYVSSEGDASDYRFDGSDFDIGQSHRLALQDCRLFNCDRHEGNILVRSPASIPASGGKADGESARLDLVPIDHAFCLPCFGFFREAEFAWRYWVSASAPFAEDVREYVKAIDVDADVQTARAVGLDEPSCATLRVCTMLLRSALLGEHRRVLTPNALAELLMRQQLDEPSPLERLCGRALGFDEELLSCDAALIDFVRQRSGSQSPSQDSFLPQPEFYVRFQELLEREYGSLP